MTVEFDEVPIDEGAAAESAITAGIKKDESDDRPRYGCGFTVGIVSALFLALLYPGEPTILPTPDCSRTDAQRYVDLRDECAPIVDPISPMTPSVRGHKECAIELPELHRRCLEAVSFEMNFFERFIHYAPWWVELDDWLEDRL